MNRHASAFQVAFTALLLAIGLPLLVLCAANVRHRQLQSRSNPRWAEFAKTNGSSEAVLRPSSAPVIAEISSSPASGHSAKLASHTRDLTGSVTGSSRIEIPVTTPTVAAVTPAVEPVPNTTSPLPSVMERRGTAVATTAPVVTFPEGDTADPVVADKEDSTDVEIEHQPQVTFRPLNEGPSERDAKSEQVQAQIEKLQQRLDQLALAQVEKQVTEFDRNARLMHNLQLAQQTPPATSASQLVPTPSAAAIPDQPKPQRATNGATGSGGREGTIKIIQGEGAGKEKFSLQVQGADLTQVLEMLAQLAGVNILASADVHGRVSLNLQDVTVERALEAILKSRGYVHERENDFIFVKTAAEAARAKQLNRKLITKVYQPNYINAAELSRLIVPVLTKGVGVHSVTSPAQVGLTQTPESSGGDGLAQRDTLLVQDYVEVLDTVDRIIVEMDVPPLQVVIEATILNVALTDSMEFGVNFSKLRCGQQPLVTSGSCVTRTSAGGSFNSNLLSNGGDCEPNAVGLKCGIVAGDVPEFVKALGSFAHTDVVASPQIRVLNKQKAEMVIGDRVSYKTREFSGRLATPRHTIENVQFLDAGTKLLFRPFISPDGLIRLEIHPEHSFATIDKTTGLPSQKSAEVTTNIMIRDGTTVAIGGLISEETIDTQERSRIRSPFSKAGVPFRNKTKTQRTELIVLITPRIVSAEETALPPASQTKRASLTK